MLINYSKVTTIRRKNVNLKLWLYKKIHFRYFCFNLKTGQNRTVLGHKSLRSKKKCNFKLIWTYYNKPHPYTSLNTVLYIFFSLKMFKFITIIKNSTGTVYSRLTTTNHNLFNYFYFKIPKNYKKSMQHVTLNNPILKQITFESFIYLTKRRSFVNNIELFFQSGYQYARATGSKARILDTNKLSQTTQILLPSKEVKLFDMYSTCNPFPLLLSDKRKLLFDNKRYKRYSGFGPLVRGVAMNAIDHPHGGKTKSIKYPKTPWGLTTKYK